MHGMLAQASAVVLFSSDPLAPGIQGTVPAMVVRPPTKGGHWLTPRWTGVVAFSVIMLLGSEGHVERSEAISSPHRARDLHRRALLEASAPHPDPT